MRQHGVGEPQRQRLGVRPEAQARRRNLRRGGDGAPLPGRQSPCDRNDVLERIVERAAPARAESFSIQSLGPHGGALPRASARR